MTIYNDVMAAQELIDEAFDPETGVVCEEQEKAARELKKEVLGLGLETLCKVRANIKSDIDALKAEEQRINAKRKTTEKRLERLENYIFAVFSQSGQSKVNAGSFTISVRMSEQVSLNEDFIDMDCKWGKFDYTPDKKKIKEALKSGIKIDGADLQVNFNLQVR